VGRVVPFAGGDDEQVEQPEARDETAFLELMDKSVEDILREGQKALFARLVAVCRSGSASHQELAILRNILKDNGLTLGIPPEGPTAPTTPMPMPDFGEPEE
jgi:hypothetical protein